MTKHWRNWLRILESPETRLVVNLAGFPGHLRLPEGWRSQGKFLREHLLYFVVEGKIQGVIEKEPRVLSSGSLVWLRPGTAFSFARAEEGELRILRCRFRAEPGRAPWPWRGWEDALGSLPWIEWLIAEGERAEAWNGLRLRGLLLGLFTELARWDGAKHEGAVGLTTAQRHALRQLIGERPDARATPRELAQAAGLSYDYFSRLFRQSYQCTPRRWLLEQRMQVAKLRLLETDRRMGEIARDLGYEDLFLFSRQFRLVTGLSPSAYRKRGWPPLAADGEYRGLTE